MKIKLKCIECKKTWASVYGNTQWYYKIQTSKETGKSTIYFKVHTYAQQCEKCEQNGKIDPYEDEFKRLSEIFSDGIAKELGKKEKFGTSGKEQRPSPNMRRGH